MLIFLIYGSDLDAIAAESQDGIQRIRNIVLSLRTFSHLDEAELKQVDLRDGLRSTLQLIRPMCKNRIEIIEDLQEIPPITCRPGELNQVFLNLLTNAVQSIAETGTIEVSTRRDEGCIVIMIRDSGAGWMKKRLSVWESHFLRPSLWERGQDLVLALVTGSLKGITEN